MSEERDILKEDFRRKRIELREILGDDRRSDIALRKKVFEELDKAKQTLIDYDNNRIADTKAEMQRKNKLFADSIKKAFEPKFICPKCDSIEGNNKLNGIPWCFACNLPLQKNVTSV